MANEIQREIRPLTEAMNLLCMVASRQTLGQYKAEIEKSVKLNARCEHIFSVLEEIVADTREALKDVWEDTIFYFGAENCGDECLAQTLYIWESHLPVWQETPEEWSDSILHMKETEYYKEVYHRLCTYNDSVQDVLGVKMGNSLSDVMTLILKMNIPDDKKLAFQDIILNRKEHFKKTDVLLGRSLKQISKYQKQIEQLLAEFYHYWSKELEEVSFPDYMKEIFQYKDETEGTITKWTLWASIFCPLRMGVTFDMNPDTGKVTGPYVGTASILFGDGYTIRDFYEAETKLSDEQAFKILRLISEKNKFEILSLTKETPAYGSMLAQQLGLTTATISHHTSELYEEHLLQLERKGNRIYYTVNQEMIKKLIRYLETKLT